ncbi:uncharacterized protein LOC118314887 [Scophthalmus maximus]|uniref:uncharacterized protein LOC118314887 n=1 Tax=Scophthalmus maximus TaxID=52904 RepID=UPI001FA84B07|nr:uncharacterized protein LOC118314887 [Scophthalmus maximus]
MLSPAAVSAAAASVWLLAVLGPGLSLSAEDNSEHGFTLCSDCFYRQTPPRGASAGPLLRPLCHRLHGGQAFATLSKPTCDTAVYSAFHLTHGWTEGEGEGGELLTEEEDNIKVAAPSLLRGDGDPSHHVSPTDSPLQRWDSTVTTLVQSSISPQCSTLGGDLYILTGQGGLGAAEDGDEECQRKPLWSAVCCAVPEGKGSFSVGLITETEEGGRQVSMKELEEMLGVAEMFPEGCGGADAETVGVVVGFHSEGIPENIEGMDAEASGEGSGYTDLDSDKAGQDAEGEASRHDAEGETSQDSEGEDSHQDIEGETSRQDTEGETSRQDTEGEASQDTEGKISHQVTRRQDTEGDTSQDTEGETSRQDTRRQDTEGETSRQDTSRQDTEGEASQDIEGKIRHQVTSRQDTEGETSADAVKSASSIEDLDTGADIFESSGDHETVDEQETDTNSTSTLVYILSTALSILKAPLCPVFSTATQLPGQVTYVLQEDLGVLSALPGDTFSLLHLLTSDLLSWIGSAGELLLGVGETGFHSTFYCTSSMLGALWSHCHTGVTGVGTLAGDTVGVFGDALDNAWWVTKFFGGRLWEQSEGYVETMVSEMGAQAKAVGGGLGRLVWRSVSGVCNVFWMVGGFIIGIVDVFIGGAREAFG